jgi:hypothetical protein
MRPDILVNPLPQSCQHHIPAGMDIGIIQPFKMIHIHNNQKNGFSNSGIVFYFT